MLQWRKRNYGKTTLNSSKGGSKLKNPTCPRCNSSNTCPIFYGYPADIEEYLQDVAQKKIRPGGCVIDNYSPKYFCNDCEFTFGRIDEDEILGEDSVF